LVTRPVVFKDVDAVRLFDFEAWRERFEATR
jgi:hypothetical protein